MTWLAVATSAVAALTSGCSEAASGGSASTTAGSATATPRSPACAALAARLPSSVLDVPRTSGPSDDSTVLASWGDPAVQLRCDVPAPGPSDDPCLGVDGVDWVLKSDPDAEGPIVFVTFGRTPYVQVTVPSFYGRQDATASLVDLAAAVAPLPSTAGCP